MTATAPIIIFDTTLRDGEQSPGCSMYLEEKITMAHLLDDMGVDVIEAGFPIASKGDFESVNEVAKIVKNATVAGLCRAKTQDIEAAAEALKPAKRKRIHTFISTSPLHMKYKLQMEPEAVLDAIAASVSTAKKFTDDVEWSAEDASRTEHDFLCRAVETAIKAGATTINVPDTVGFAIPEEYGALFKMLIERVPNADKAVFSVHCHNDLGLAVANTVAGIQNGARQVECTINGIGERAGNAALEEVVMTLRTRAAMLPYETKIDATKITRASKTLSNITGINVQPNKAIVGANAFAHESGIHQDGMLKNALTYEIMTPESVGLQKSELVLGKHSGRHAFKSKLEEMGYSLGDNAFQDAFNRFKDLADKKKVVFEEDILTLIDEKSVGRNDRIRFVDLDVRAGTKGPQSADLTLDVNGKREQAQANGNGPVDSIFNAIRKIVPHDGIDLALFQVHAVTGGTDAMCAVTVKLEKDGQTFMGQSNDLDSMVASCKAYVHALNKAMSAKISAAKTGKDNPRYATP
jgi:2-isopropylmalate synthase